MRCRHVVDDSMRNLSRVGKVGCLVCGRWNVKVLRLQDQNKEERPALYTHASTALSKECVLISVPEYARAVLSRRVRLTPSVEIRIVRPLSKPEI